MEVYQYANGAYLPASSQPSNTIDFEIKTKKYTPHESVRYMNVYVGSNGIAKRANSTGSLIDCEKNLPVLYEKRESCCGCTACFAICPVQAISMLPDEEGFLYPVVDAEKCIRCYKCISVCAFKKDQKEKGYLE
ncbi:NADH-quinone oxidoreductase subunit I [Mediterraneibacter glycyrrhizinilyticus]|uniref:NADH-quinone oxidoreductase subunit I n=1 Tax=Mediterraneibacter glycyrrhizinilyticus TaxID=342942 RepID=UPI0025A3C7FC|nr:4Fe-4S dicluster domain-containing protein [Mediterraneibacter glycyrrhizinilyticus]MDM8125547.1 4Fe-4S dicluster domain-containing protein [Mediterraneibacter glycyrrhizinilyticus]